MDFSLIYSQHRALTLHRNNADIFFPFFFSFIEESITRTLLESVRADRARLLAGLVLHRRTGLPIETPEKPNRE